ncbi:BrnT family toxin [Alysiella filiformis]|nr:BrnT family toxin [Alysiella filiformis]QMT31513.1 BrnT family toxin [Alysiella filiformis]UBQ55475.1 BrnT family toxin [Alysiella filiformis DSM 16848]
MFEFEYDPNKSQSNHTKHGIDFETAQYLWQDPQLLSIPIQTEPEIRHLAIGIIGEKHWSAIYTHRNGKIRLISVRRSRDKEKMLYETH